MKTRKFLIPAIICGIAIGSVVGCSKSDDAEPLPPIGGYNSADEVGEANLLAYWPLDGDGVEALSSTAPSSSSHAVFGAGQKGEAVTLTNGYLAYPALTTLSTSLTSFSMSAWIKVKNNGVSASVFLSLSRPNEWAGNINFMAETGWKTAEIDSLTVKGLVVSNNTLGWQDSRNTITSSPDDLAAGHVPFPNKIADIWSHAVITWDGPTRAFKVYVNGVKISNPAWEIRGAADSPAILFTTPTRPIIGAFETFVTGASGDAWNQGMTGQLDEIRVWNKALPQSDINALYELEKVGR